MNKVRNYQKELDQIIEGMRKDEKCAAGGDVPTLFLHSCCAPCSSYVLSYLRQYFRITVFYYNPNITEDAEYHKRVAEQKRLIAAFNEELTGSVGGAPVNGGSCAVCDVDGGNGGGYEIHIVEGDYDPARFFEIAKGLEQCPEGGERCFACYELRLGETARLAQAGGYDYFTTTLSISPLKNAAKLNEIGERMASKYSVAWLPSDFKKRDGYKRSIELSKEYDLYRQDYCGCVYSRRKQGIE
jgi:hypothetical protein